MTSYDTGSTSHSNSFLVPKINPDKQKITLPCSWTQRVTAWLWSGCQSDQRKHKGNGRGGERGWEGYDLLPCPCPGFGGWQLYCHLIVTLQSHQAIQWNINQWQAHLELETIYYWLFNNHAHVHLNSFSIKLRYNYMASSILLINFNITCFKTKDNKYIYNHQSLEIQVTCIHR